MYKQVIVIRRDLKLSKGKLAAQAAHASLDSYKKADEKTKKEWEQQGEKKVVVRVESLKELLDVFKKAMDMGLPCSLIKDAGKTELSPGTVTALGIGPCRDNDVDRITKNLKLL